MKTREHALAVLMDLETELAGVDCGRYMRLRRIAGFSTVALALRQQMLPDDHEWLTQQLIRAARAHGIPDECVLPDEPIRIGPAPEVPTPLEPPVPGGLACRS